MADPVTPNWGLPYPVNSDSVTNGAAAVAALAARLDAILSAVSAPPVGSMMAYATNSVPPAGGDSVSRWMFSDGSAISRTTYATLYGLIGSTFGAGDGATTFNLPNTLGRTVVGYGNSGATGASSLAFGAYGGEAAHVLSVAELASHAHSVADPGHAHSIYDPGHAHSMESGSATATFNYGSQFTTHGYGTDPTTYNGTGIGIYAAATGIGIYGTGSNYGHNNMQPYITLGWIIKVQ